MKIFSIISTILLSIILLLFIGGNGDNFLICFLGIVLGLSYSITSLIKFNSSNKYSNVTQQLLDLKQLKDGGIISEDEFQAKKIDLLN